MRLCFKNRDTIYIVSLFKNNVLAIFKFLLVTLLFHHGKLLGGRRSKRMEGKSGNDVVFGVVQGGGAYLYGVVPTRAYLYARGPL